LTGKSSGSGRAIPHDDHRLAVQAEFSWLLARRKIGVEARGLPQL
jgi:hypothetical protein